MPYAQASRQLIALARKKVHGLFGVVRGGGSASEQVACTVARFLVRKITAEERQAALHGKWPAR
eukprot:1988837-Prorocentrum_lima.AAC.1